jgi:hypothetical protein
MPVSGTATSACARGAEAAVMMASNAEISASVGGPASIGRRIQHSFRVALAL